MSTPAFVLGGTGYVAGELLRLIAGHPGLKLDAIMSDSQPGESVARAFPHLQSAYPELTFTSHAEIATAIAREKVSALFSAAPHGVSAALVDGLLKRAQEAGVRVHAVDISADFRHSSPAVYEKIYQHEHGAPERLKEFSCAVPEHLKALTTPHVAHPGCFATAVLLASVPLLALGLVEPQLFVAGVTGSTGSGRKPTEGTHHPLRHSDLYTYNALTHRHTQEIAACAQAASGVAAEIAFVPHSGPFARGIHVAVQARLKKESDSAMIRAALEAYYGNCPFVRIKAEAPRIKDVVASNYAHLGAAANGCSVAVMCAIDNLNKGAAGGAVQWMNRLLGLEETAGLTTPAAGWT
ncbi:MAG TPA: N-acetyl-gamma-glutamyl-phosphate reductase [Steroidobacteraceae bacterium]|nr:N-acetyl-gamma-glutamyl-phosphate reductase [Steroidobacteraceae bacterium]